MKLKEIMERARNVARHPGGDHAAKVRGYLTHLATERQV